MLGTISDMLKDLSDEFARPAEVPNKAEAPSKSLVRPVRRQHRLARSSTLSQWRFARPLKPRLKSSRQSPVRYWRPW
jgi:hypothetical protein